MKSRRNSLIILFICGALIFAAGYLLCILVNASFTIMGVEAKEIEEIVFAGFKSVIIISQIKILAVYILLGGLTGLSVFYNLSIYSYLTGREIGFIRLFMSIVTFCIAVEFIFLIYDISTHPALYNEVFYSQRGILRRFQVFITDWTPRLILSILRIFVILLFLPLLIAGITSIFKAIIRLFKLFPLYSGISLSVIAALIIIIIASGRGGINEGPNIIILSADSFRYDRVTAYGYYRNLTPNIDKLVNEGFSFTNLHVQLPRTFPSWYCLLTGKYPYGHGIRHMFPRKERLDAYEADLPIVLKKHKYATSVIADYAGDIFSRMKGFDRVDAPYFNFLTMIKQRSLEIQFFILPYLQNSIARFLFPELRWFAQNSDPEFLKNDVISELDYLSNKKRFFLTVFFSATHFPYASPYPYYELFAEDDYKGEFKYLKINDPTITRIITDKDKKQIRALFDGACRSIDTAVGDIIRELKDKGLYDNTIIIFTSDHGENIYEHGMDIGHGQHFRGEFATHIPFVIKFHRDYAKKVRIKHYDGIVEQVDFLPTILDILDINWDKDVNGVSFREVLEGKRRAIRKIAYSESGAWFVDKGGQFFQQQRIKYPDVSKLCRIDSRNNEIVLKEEYEELINIAKHRAVFDERYKLVYMPTGTGARFELYRMGDKSYRDLFYRDHPQFKRLYRHLTKFMEKNENMKRVNGMFVPF